jgi:hypothetical protein
MYKDVALNQLVIFARDLITETGTTGKMNPHRFRHSYGTMIVRQNNMEVDKELLGHSDIATTSLYVHPNTQDHHDAADRVELVPQSVATRRDLTNRPDNSLSATGTLERYHLEHAEPGAQDIPPILKSPQLDTFPPDRDLKDRCHYLLGESIKIARMLPAHLLNRLTPERLLEAALGTCSTTSPDIELTIATAAAVLSWTHDLPIPVDPLLTAYGIHAEMALTNLLSTLELLRDFQAPHH